MKGFLTTMVVILILSGGLKPEKSGEGILCLPYTANCNGCKKYNFQLIFLFFA